LDIGCIVLVGGKGSRLGRNKAQEIVGKKSLFHWVLDSVDFLKSEVIVVTGAEEFSSWLTRCPSRYKVVADIYPSRGPMVGIFTGLTASKSLYNLVVGCDMPFLNQGLLSYMTQIAAGFDLVIPRLGNMVEPLHAVYSKSCLVPMERMIEQDDLGINRLLGLVKVRYVDSDEIDRFDPEHLSFFNVNTEADLKMARGLVNRGDIFNAQC
jgi:molybdopterin-guanine dinucleotide biosynthesis protein A